MKPKGSQFGPRWRVYETDEKELWAGGTQRGRTYSLFDPEEKGGLRYEIDYGDQSPVYGQIKVQEIDRPPRYSYDQHYTNDRNQIDGQRSLFGVTEHGKEMKVNTAFVSRPHAMKAGSVFGHLVNRASEQGMRLVPDTDLSQHSGGLVNRAIDAGLIDKSYEFDPEFDNGYEFENGPVDYVSNTEIRGYSEMSPNDLRAGTRTVRNIVKAGRPPKKMRGEQELPF